MKSIPALCLVLAVLFGFSLHEAHGQTPETHVPLMLMGQWNGVYQYYAYKCPSGPYNVVFTDRLHTTGTDCDHNSDPIYKIPPAFTPKLNNLDAIVHIRPQLTIRNYSGHQKKNKVGVGEAENGTFFAAAPRCAPVDDIILKVTNVVGGDRYFRVLIFRPDYAKFSDLGTDVANSLRDQTIQIGQEMHVDHVKSGEAIDATVEESDDSGGSNPDLELRHHVVKYTIDGKPEQRCVVISKNRMKKKD